MTDITPVALDHAAASQLASDAPAFSDGQGVEIAYFTLPVEEGRGVATSMAHALVRVACAVPQQVVAVRAHTLTERNASCRVLEQLGFQHAGSMLHADDGPVWRWERLVPGDGDVCA